MPDRLAYPLLALTAAALILVAIVWPQGEGTPTPWLGPASAPASHASASPSAKAQPADPLTALARKAMSTLKKKSSAF
jgi:hypothetical protein